MADPRPGVEIDLRQLPLDCDPGDIARSWYQLESAFGITQAQRTARENDSGGFRFYICPTQFWDVEEGTFTVGFVEEQEGPKEVWPRGELVQFLKYEAEVWLKERQWLARLYGSLLPKYGYESPEDVEMLEAMEQLPCTAVGMWLFPAEAFNKPIDLQRVCFDARTARPGLFLFEV